MVGLRALCPEARLDVAQALAIGELRERHRQILIEAGEALDLVRAAVAHSAAMKRGEGQVLHHLGEHVLALAHRNPRRAAAGSQDEVGRRPLRGSNRHQKKTALPCGYSIT